MVDNYVIYLVSAMIGVGSLLCGLIYIEEHDRLAERQIFLDTVSCDQLSGWADQEKKIHEKQILPDKSNLNQYELALERKGCV